MQSKRRSLVEAATNTIAGYWLSVAVVAIVYPLYGLQITTAQNMQVSLYFVAASFARGYVLRRVFSFVDRSYPTQK